MNCTAVGAPSGKSTPAAILQNATSQDYEQYLQARPCKGHRHDRLEARCFEPAMNPSPQLIIEGTRFFTGASSMVCEPQILCSTWVGSGAIPTLFVSSSLSHHGRRRCAHPGGMTAPTPPFTPGSPLPHSLQLPPSSSSDGHPWRSPSPFWDKEGFMRPQIPVSIQHPAECSSLHCAHS